MNGCNRLHPICARSFIRCMRTLVSTSWHNGSLDTLVPNSLAALSPELFSRRMITLGELAKAFSELGTSTDSTSEPAPISQVKHHDHHAKKTWDFTVKENQTFICKKEENTQENSICSEVEHVSAVDRALTKDMWSRRLFPMSAISSQVATQPILNLSLAYARRLRTLPEADLTAEVTISYRRLNYGNMIQCLIEVWRRLDWLDATADTMGTRFGGCECRYNVWNASPKLYMNDENLTEEGVEETKTYEDREEDDNNHRCAGSNMSLNSLYIAPEEAVPQTEFNEFTSFRSDRLLEAVLRCLCKMDLIELEPEICAWIEYHKSELHFAQGVGTENVTPAQESSDITQLHPQNLCRIMSSVGQQVWELELPSSGVRCCYAYPWPAAFEFTAPHFTCSPIERDEQRQGLVDRANEVSLSNVAPQFVYKLSKYLLQWLLMRVSSFDAEMSVILLHLVVQQRLFFSDALLETLADNIVLGIQQLSMRRLSVLIDAIHRYQTSVVNVARWRNTGKKAENHYPLKPTGSIDFRSSSMLLEMPMPLPTACQDFFSPNNTSLLHTQSSRTLRNGPDGHPIVNRWLYNSVVEQIILILSRYQQGEDHAQTREGEELSKVGKPSAACFAGWSQISPTGFLFLTRALARITFFHPDLVPAMLPGLAAFLRQHPEPYLGIVLLLGRRENCVVDAEVMYVLLKNITTMLERRRGAKSQAATKGTDVSECMDNATDILSLAGHQDQNSVGESFVSLEYASHARIRRYVGEKINRSNEKVEQQLMLLSDEYCYDEVPFQDFVESGGGSFLHNSAPRYQMGLIDIHALPAFLRSISRLFRLALSQCSPEITSRRNTQCKSSVNSHKNMKIDDDAANGDAEQEVFHNITREALQCAMIHFLKLLYNDTHCGISSLRVLEHNFSLVVVQRLLSLVLDTNKFIEEILRPTNSTPVVGVGSGKMTNSDTVRCEDAEVGGRAQRANVISNNSSSDSISALVSHVLVVELTYVWVRQIGSYFGKQQNQISLRSPVRQQQILHMVDQLQWFGMLKRVEYQLSGKVNLVDTGFQTCGFAAPKTDGETVVRYVIPFEAVSKSHRVTKAISLEKESILQKLLAKRHKMRDESKRFLEDREVSIPVLKASAVFAPFSKVVNALRR